MTDDAPPPLDPERVFATLERHGVDFTIIGGFAVIAHGHVRATKDIDILAAQERENLRRLAAAFAELGARLRGVDANLLPVDPTDPEDLGNGANWTLETDAGWVDYMSDVPGGVPYEEIRAEARVVEIRGVRLKVAGLAHLLRMKRAAGRPRDLADIAALTPDQPDTTPGM
ncbi:MAG: hypothetical protein ACRDWI_19435 [Jiangellaceae bacterium]